MFAQHKNLIKLSGGQSIVEYLLFFTVMAVLTLLSLSTLYPRLHQTSENAFEEAVGAITRRF